jgi:putative transposase
VDRLFQQIGQLHYELTWLKKSWRGTLPQKRHAIEVDEPCLSVRRQCDLLGLSRGSWHYQSVGESEENLQLMRLLDEQYTSTPYYGVLRMTAWLQRQGYAVNDKRVRRLLRTMGLMAIYPSPTTSRPAPAHRIYPYLLRGVAITRPNFVWSTEEVYLNSYSSVQDAWHGLHRYSVYYNHERPHQALGYLTPAEVYGQEHA